MTIGRDSHTATLLLDGRVLIAGGEGYDAARSAELYDPKTGKFSPTGSMSVGHEVATATLLLDGRVLISGGWEYTDRNHRVESASAELYDPSTGKFALSGSTPTSIWLHAATLLQDGRVLITGGRATNDSIYSTACVYDPKTGKFTRTGSMTASRQEHTATLLPDGQVLIAGGLSGASMTANATSSAELYDPKTGKFTPAGTMVSARMDQTADLLSDGSVLIASGDVIGPGGWQPVTSGELYRP
jgi:WD40 repeat protein